MRREVTPYHSSPKQQSPLPELVRLIQKCEGAKLRRRRRICQTFFKMHYRIFKFRIIFRETKKNRNVAKLQHSLSPHDLPDPYEYKILLSWVALPAGWPPRHEDVKDDNSSNELGDLL